MRATSHTQPIAVVRRKGDLYCDGRHVAQPTAAGDRHGRVWVEGRGPHEGLARRARLRADGRPRRDSDAAPILMLDGTAAAAAAAAAARAPSGRAACVAALDWRRHRASLRRLPASSPRPGTQKGRDALPPAPRRRAWHSAAAAALAQRPPVCCASSAPPARAALEWKSRTLPGQAVIDFSSSYKRRLASIRGTNLRYRNTIRGNRVCSIYLRQRFSSSPTIPEVLPLSSIFFFIP